MPKAKAALPPFAARLAALRERRGWTVYRLERESGVARSYLHQLERGEKSPGWDVVLRLCAALGAEPNDFC